ncbi:NAD(P)H-binding protein [Streptomyces sp. NPDC005574]|uniref:SDR family oxidoreductase n=1 Tax=Streptomyces sp. NPDC005574 TaxID=3156891 RepID=UPI0033ADD84D
MIVVTGAGGNVGRTLVRGLVESGESVTAVARRITDGDVPAEARAVPADLAAPRSLRPALSGADALFLLVAGEDPGGILAEARDAGVRKVVLLSSQGVGTRPDAYEHAARFETAVADSGLDWTVLRSGGMASNTFAWAESIRNDRTATAPFGNVGLPFVDPDDVAAVAAAVLRAAGHKGATYVLTGPEPTTPRGRAAAIADALGEPVRFVEQTREEAHAQMSRFMPLPVVEGTLAILGEPTPEEQRVSPDVSDLLDRPAHSFATWARRNAAAFR